MSDNTTRALEIIAGHMDQVEAAHLAQADAADASATAARAAAASASVTRQALMALASTHGIDDVQDTGLRHLDLTETEIKMMAAAAPIFVLIRHHESRGNYNAVFGNASGYPGVDITAMTLAEVRAWQDWYVRVKGSKSSAAGAYQIIRKTFDGLRAQIAFPASARYGPDVQDRMAMQLLIGRGLTRFLTGRLSADGLADGLAYEWASLPLASGKSAYDGDGLNSASAMRADVMRAIGEAKEAFK